MLEMEMKMELGPKHCIGLELGEELELLVG